MEILFENRYTMTKERYMEWFKNPIKKNYFTILWSVIMIITFFTFIICILNKDIVNSAFSLILIAFCIYRGFFRTKILSSRYFEKLAINQGAEEWERIIQFTDYITIIDGKTSVQYQWSQISKLIDNKDYLILVLKNEFGIRLAKNAFTKGDSEMFLNFIKKEYQNISIINKK